MKITICFLLVVLSSCFAADAPRGLGSCRGHISPVQANIMASTVTTLFDKYIKLKKKGLENSSKKDCLLNSAMIIVGMAAGYKDCHVSVIVEEVLACMKVAETQKDLLREAFKTGDPSKARDFNADIKDLMEAICCATKKMISNDGHNPTVVFNRVLPGLEFMLGHNLKDVTNLLGLFLGIVFPLGGIAHGLLNGLLNLGSHP